WTGGGHPARRSSGRSRRCRILFHGRAEFVEGTVVSRILFRDALGDGLGALKPRAGVEVNALLAAMELEAATRALAVRIEARQQNGAAIRAARAGDRADHPRRSRTNLFLARATLGRPVLLLLRLIAVHIAPLPILALQGDLQR